MNDGSAEGQIVRVVHCVDTEGPLYESLEETFARVEAILGLHLESSRETLMALQRGELDLGGREKVAREIFAPELLAYLDTWDKIDDMLDEALSPGFRQRHPDSLGGGWRFSWFPLDHVGYRVNPRRRTMGYHAIFDHYRRRLSEAEACGDEVHWHFHPMSTFREAHRCATAWLTSPHLLETLCRRVIDRTWFPTCFRAGFHTERPDSHWFLEQWIPFDFSNQSLAEGERERSQADAGNGRFGDWRRAPSDWSYYHPAHDDYQREGDCNRYIFRCLNVGTRLRLLDQSEVDRAFARAASGRPSVLAFTDHDFRDLRADVDHVYGMLEDAADRFPQVPWRHSGAKAAARAAAGLPERGSLELEVELELSGSGRRITVETSADTFGPQPFLALKTRDQRYRWDNFDFQEPRRRWTYSFDADSVPLDSLEAIGVAATGSDGACVVTVLDSDGRVRSRERYD